MNSEIILERRFPMIELFQLEQLTAFADYKTLSKAAEMLHMSQPTLTRSMQKLESEFDVSLFRRTKNKLELNENGELVYYYCDIIKSEYQKDENIWIFTDLLADVKIYPNGATEVVDLGELSQAYRKNLISAEIVMEALEKLDKLLNLVYSGKWKDLTDRYFK